jgi:hypothetical protein
MSDKVREARQKKYDTFMDKVKAIAGLTGKEYDAGNLHMAAMQDLEGFCNKVRGAEEALMSAKVIWGRSTLDDGSRGLPVVDGESVDRLRELVVDMLEWPAWKTRQEAEGTGDLAGVVKMEMAWNPATDQRSQVVKAEAAGTPLWDRALVHPWTVRHYMRVGDTLELRDVTSLAVAFGGFSLPQHTRDRISAKSPAEIELDAELRLSHAARAEADAEAKRKAKEAEAKRKAEEAEAKAAEEAAARPFLARIAALKAELEAEEKRKAEEAEAKRKAEEAEAKAKARALWLANQPPQVALAKGLWGDLREQVAKERAAFVSLLEGEGLEERLSDLGTLEKLEVYSQLAAIAASLARYTAEEKLSKLEEMENLPWLLQNIPQLPGEWKDPSSEEEWGEFQKANQFAFGRIRFVEEEEVEEEPKPKTKARKKPTAPKGSDADLRELAAEEEEEKPKTRRRSSKG